MTMVNVTFPDGNYGEVNSDYMTVTQAFEAVANGRITLEEFQDWVSNQRSDAYVDGANNQSESMTCGYDY